MNAYKLADKLNEWYNFSHENMCNEAASMLREQAEQLEDYKFELKLHKAMIYDLETVLESFLVERKVSTK